MPAASSNHHLGVTQVERYFIATSSLSTYWISMYKAGTLYYWVDGTFIGGLIPKKGNPYVHVSSTLGWHLEQAISEMVEDMWQLQCLSRLE
jgi:hypothetical protein